MALVDGDGENGEAGGGEGEAGRGGHLEGFLRVV
jgi:hypothetical protein